MNTTEIIKEKAKEYASNFGHDATIAGARLAFGLAADWLRQEAEKIRAEAELKDEDCEGQVETHHRLADVIGSMARELPVPEQSGPKSFLRGLPE